MENKNKEMIQPEALEQVAGGAGLAEEKQAEFEAAWEKRIPVFMDYLWG